VGAGWAAQTQEPTFSPPKNRMSLKFLNGLLTSRPRGRRMGSPTPRAHFQPPKNRIHLSFYMSTHIAPLRGKYSEALPAQARPKSGLVGLGCPSCAHLGLMSAARLRTLATFDFYAGRKWARGLGLPIRRPPGRDVSSPFKSLSQIGFLGGLKVGSWVWAAHPVPTLA